MIEIVDRKLTMQQMSAEFKNDNKHDKSSFDKEEKEEKSENRGEAPAVGLGSILGGGNGLGGGFGRGGGGGLSAGLAAGLQNMFLKPQRIAPQTTTVEQVSVFDNS